MIMKIAVLSDIHGNSIALQAVLTDIENQGGVDECFVLGDLVALGHDPVKVMQLLGELPQARYIRGNTDRYVVSGFHSGPPLSEVQNDLPRLEQRLRMVSSMSWTAGAVAATGYLSKLEELPLDMRLTLPDGTRLLAVHAAPGTDDGLGVNPTTPDARLRELLSGVEADLILVGHTHSPFDRTIDGMRVFNPGSVSNPFPPDLRAKYALLTAEKHSYSLEFHAADYDHQAVIDALERLNHPSVKYISGYMRGENKPGWLKP
jgi:predicted phosphodiesterase